MFGSFLNLVSDRLPNGKNTLVGRSKCEFCDKPLTARNLLPIVSFIIQKGKCANCKHKLSYYYPFSEILAGAMFVGVAYLTQVFAGSLNFNKVYGFVYLTVIACFYIVLVLVDIKYRLLPDKIVFSAISFVLIFLLTNLILSLVFTYKALQSDTFGVYLLEAGYMHRLIITALQSFGILLLSSFGIAMFFIFLIWITKGKGMGGGDVKLAFLIGIINGFPLNVVGIFLGFVFGAVYSGGLMLLRKKNLKDTIAFGPFLILGSIVAFVWGNLLFNWYLGLL